MSSFFGPIGMGAFWTLQAAGLMSTLIARRAQGASRRRWQWSFFAFLLLVGTATMVVAAVDPASSLSCGVTLAAMVIGIVWDANGELPSSPHPRR